MVTICNLSNGWNISGLNLPCYAFELNSTNFCQLIAPVSKQKSFENSLTNLLIISAYDLRKSSFLSFDRCPSGMMRPV